MFLPGTFLPPVMTAILLFFLVLWTFRALLLLYAVPQLWSEWQLADDEYFRALIGSDALPPVSVIATLYNDEVGVVERIQGLLDLEYPRHEVVVINDGSSDGTMELLVRAFGLAQVSPAFTTTIPTRPVRGYYRSQREGRLLVVDKERGGRADALNAGINVSRYPYTLTSGARILFEPDALRRLTRPFLLNKSVCAVATALRIANGGRMVRGRFAAVVPSRFLVGVHTVDMIQTYVYERLGWNRIASNLLFPGSVALFRREHLLALRGFRADSATPGTEFVLRLQRYLTDHGVNARMLAIPDPVAWTDFGEQVFQGTSRVIRHRGLLRGLVEHRALCGNPEYGTLGVLALPYYWASHVVAPFLELLGYAGLIIGGVTGILSVGFLVAYLGVVLGYGMLLSVWTVVLESLSDHRYTHPGAFRRLLLYAIAQPFGYQQRAAWHHVRACFPVSPTTHSPRPSSSPSSPLSHTI